MLERNVDTVVKISIALVVFVLQPWAVPFATAVGGIPEVIRDGVTGLLVPLRDPVKLSSAISKLINDKTLMSKIRTEARTLIQKEFDSHIMVDKYMELYEKLIGTYRGK